MQSDVLPYHLPKTLKSQLQYLARITSLPINLIDNAGQAELEAISVMILYRHLSRQQRIEAMQTIRSVENRALMGSIITKALDTTFVNPQWGIWSLSTEELLEDIKFHASIDSVVGYIGVGASVLGGKDLIKNIWSQKRMGRQHWIMLVIWGCIYMNKQELIKAQQEQSHRTTTKSSRFYL